MFSKIIKRQLAYSSATRAGFSSLKRTINDLFHTPEQSDQHVKIATYNPLKAVDTHNIILSTDQKPKHEITRLNNGVTVLTESIVFPNVIDLGILLSLGTRDENLDTSGSLFLLKSNYHQNFLPIDQGINKVVQTSGIDLEMDYDQENTYFKANCLAHHVNDIFGTLMDSALKPISTDAAERTLQQALEQQAMIQQLGGGGEDLHDRIMRTAFGLRQLGMPIYGIQENITRMTPSTLQKFQKETFTPNRVFICAAGVEDHQEFVKLVESKLSWMPPTSGSIKTREFSEYTGGDSRNDTGAEEVTIALAFKAVTWTDPDVYAFQVLNTLLGSSASFSTGGPGKGMHSRATKHLLNRLSYVDSANALFTGFSDSGLFGLILGGPASDANNLLKATINELKGLARPIPDIELQRAKNITKSNILMALERQKERLEETVKNLKTFGRLTFHEYCEKIDQVTSDQINNAMARALSSQPTFVAEGGGLSRLPSYDKIQNMIKL